MILTGLSFFLLNLLSLSLGTRHNKLCFVPAALSVGLISRNELSDSPMIAGFLALSIVIFVYGFFSWEYLGRHILRMTKTDLVTMSFITVALMVGSIGLMLYYEREYFVFNAFTLAAFFVVSLLIARGVHDGWLFLAALSIVTLIATSILGLWGIAVGSFIFALGGLYVFADWSLDYYGSIRFRIVE